MAIELYWGSGSPFAWRVMLTLEYKKLPYESRLLEFSKGEHKTPEYLHLNPRGKVPTLRDDDFVIYESLAIMAYLDRRYPEPQVFGATAQETGLIWRIISEADSYLLPAGDKLIHAFFFGQGLDDRGEIERAAEAARAELKTLDAQLTDSRWLAGERLSAADIAVFPLVQILMRAASKEAAASFNLMLLPIADNYPHLAAWIQRVEALPGYERTYPPHWR
jgi:glutathione S-transferase